MSVTYTCPRAGDDVPEVNLANVNAAAILDLLGLDATYLVGRVEVEDLPKLLRRIVHALNTDRSDLIREPVEIPGGHAGVVVVEGGDGVTQIERRGCRAWIGGNTDEQTVRRLRDLIRLVQWAQKRGLPVTWG